MCGLRSLRNFEVRWKMAPPLGYPKTKKLSASGASPLTPDQGLCPWTPLGAPPQDPRAFPQLQICHYTNARAPRARHGPRPFWSAFASLPSSFPDLPLSPSLPHSPVSPPFSPNPSFPSCHKAAALKLTTGSVESCKRSPSRHILVYSERKTHLTAIIIWIFVYWNLLNFW